jgi:crotonobetainyl-CoA:carnitine CoA-transferase CaiB-like acyl-CoA transferase
LDGLVVLDLTRFLAGPYCTLLLARLGAEVIKVEPPGEGDPFRDRPPFAGPRGISLTRQTDDDIGLSLLHRARGKKSITLNLRSPEGVELFKRLATRADIVVENFAPGALERIGIGFPALQAANPRLILCSISGFGQRGPYREWRAYDPIVQAMSGISSVTGYPDRPPVRCGAAVSDTTAPLLAVIGILSALRLRETTGEGEWVDISMQDSSLFLLPELVEFLAGGMIPARMGNAHVGSVPFNVYQAKDGYVSVCVVTDREWENLLAALGRQELARDSRYRSLLDRFERREEIDGMVQEWAAQRTVAEAVGTLQTHRVPAGPILSLPELLRDEHLAEREMLVDLAHPKHGVAPGVKGLGMPIKFVRHPLAADRAAPVLGAHNEEVYGRLLGLDAAALSELRGRGVV